MKRSSTIMASILSTGVLLLAGCGGDDGNGLRHAVTACEAALMPTDPADSDRSSDVARGAAAAASEADDRWSDVESAVTGFIDARAAALDAADGASIDTLGDIQAKADEALRLRDDVMASCREVKDAGGKLPDYGVSESP